jgi:hypothetical protein
MYLMRYLDVDLEELAFALDFRPEGMNHYLDLETGQVVSVSDESRRELERLYAGIEPGEGETPPPLEQLLQASPLHDWQKEEVRQAAAVEAGYGTRFVAIPRLETHESYRDMEDFIITVRDARLRERLAAAIQGRGAFRRFKDVLERYPHERERWFTFQHDRMTQRAREWLESLGIAPTPKQEP